jgi:hypothetical protein
MLARINSLFCYYHIHFILFSTLPISLFVMLSRKNLFAENESEAANLKWLMRYTQECPKCTAPIEKVRPDCILMMIL